MPTQIRRVGQRAFLFATVSQELLGDWLQEHLGEHRFDVDLPARKLDFSSPRGVVSARAHFVASIAVQPATMLWGWAPPFTTQVGGDEVVHAMRGFGQRHSLAEFTTEEVAYDVRPDTQKGDIAELGHDIGQAAVEASGPAFHYYTFASGGAGSRGVLLLDQFSVPPPQPTMADLFVKLPRLVASCDDLGWSLGGLADLMGWRAERRPDPAPRTVSWAMTDRSGDSFSLQVGYDEHDRIADVRADGIHRAGG